LPMRPSVRSRLMTDCLRCGEQRSICLGFLPRSRQIVGTCLLLGAAPENVEDRTRTQNLLGNLANSGPGSKPTPRPAIARRASAYVACLRPSGPAVGKALTYAGPGATRAAESAAIAWHSAATAPPPPPRFAVLMSASVTASRFSSNDDRHCPNSPSNRSRRTRPRAIGPRTFCRRSFRCLRPRRRQRFDDSALRFEIGSPYTSRHDRFGHPTAQPAITL